MLYRENSTKKKKNYLYYNSIAAHPYNWIGICGKDCHDDSLLPLRAFNVYTPVNKWKKELGEI